MMNREPTMSVVLMVALACAGVLASGGCKRRTAPPPTRPPVASAPAADEPAAEEIAEEDAPVPPAPEVALDINSETEPSIHAGTPFVLTVRLANQRAENILSANAAGSQPAARQPVPVVQLAPGWPQRVKFAIRADGGKESVAWPVMPLGTPPPEQAVTLDGRTNPEAKWGLPPERAACLTPGVYQIVAVMEFPDTQAGAWQGRVESAPVVLTIKPRPAALTGPEAAQAEAVAARYWAQAGDWEKSLASARKAATEDPDSIEAQRLAGDALAASKDADGARAAYETALKLFRKQDKAGSYEPPDYLLHQLHLLDQNKQPEGK